MSGATVATARWRRLDCEGEDKCRLARLDEGWMLVGHARFRSNGAWSALDYVVRCGPDWLTTSADVTGTHAGRDVALRFVRDGATWRCGADPVPEVAGAEDIDLGFSPATNLMPIRRLPDVGRITPTAAWLSDPGGPLLPLDQSYTRERGGLVFYAARQTGFSAHLRVGVHGFIEHYPGLWERVDAG